MQDIISCLECGNCTYIGGGDYICDEIHEIVIEGFGQPTMYWMLCRRGSMACGDLAIN